MEDKRDTGLERAIEVAGSQAELARRIGATLQAVNQWRQVPVMRVLAVENATGIPRHELRPDVYPPAEVN